MNDLYNNLNIQTTADEIRTFYELLGNSEITISFWGSRQIRYENKQMAFSEIEYKIATISENVREINQIDPLQSKNWKLLCKRITKIGIQYDQLASNNKFSLTYLFYLIRSLRLVSLLFREDSIKDNFAIKQNAIEMAPDWLI